MLRRTVSTYRPHTTSKPPINNSTSPDPQALKSVFLASQSNCNAIPMAAPHRHATMQSMSNGGISSGSDRPQQHSQLSQQSPGLRVPSNRKTIYDRHLNRTRTAELSRASFAFLFGEMVTYAQRRVTGIQDLEKR